MSARQIIVAGAMPSRDVNGRSLPGRLRFYLPGSGGVPATVYANSALTIGHPWPLLSDSAGRWPPIWAEETLYFDVAWSDLATDSNIATYRDIRPLYDYVGAASDLATSSASAAAASAAAALASELAAAASAAAALSPGFSTLSTSAITIPASVPQIISFELEDDAFGLGQTLKFSLASDLTKNFTGDVATYEDGVGTLNALIKNGAGSGSLWVVTLAAPVDNSLTTRVTALEVSATVAKVRAGTEADEYITPATLSGSQAWIPLTDAATVAWNAATGYNAKVVQTAARTIGAPTNLVDGQTYSLLVDCGGFTPSWNAIWDFGEAGTPVPDTTAGKKHLVTAIYDAAQTKLLASYRPPA